MKLSVLAASLTLAALPAFAESVRVVDGDTLRVDGVTYRLWGIDAPESGQPCADGWPAGQTACVCRKPRPERNDGEGRQARDVSKSFQ
jgi:endonuclease YncB( thermonuclease family)